MAVKKLSEITASAANFTSGDFIVAVQSGTDDVLFSFAQLSANLSTGLTVGTSAITNGTTTRILYDNAGTLGETTGVTFAGTGQLALAAGTITSSLPGTVITQVWNNSTVTFTGAKVNITATASAAGSKLLDCQIGGVSLFSLIPDTLGSTQMLQFAGTSGITSINGFGFTFHSAGAGGDSYVGYYGLVTNSNGSIGFSSSSTQAINSGDAIFTRDAAGIIAQRNSTNAQTYRLYNTFTDASNYERLALDWTTTANQLSLMVQAAGTGTQRRLAFIDNGGGFVFADSGGIGTNIVQRTAFKLSASNMFAWSNTSNDATQTTDTALGRTAAGIVEVNTGTAGSLASIKVSTIIGSSQTLSLPAATATLGYLNLPVNSQNAPYTVALADSGKLIAIGTTGTLTIPANSVVAFTTGTVLTYANGTAASVIAITSDTMTLAGSASTGPRTLAANALATVVKLTSTSWLATGTGVT